LPILLDKKNWEMPLFDLQNIILGFDRGGEAHKPDFKGGLVKRRDEVNIFSEVSY
jgi:hypothetical protein